MYPESMEHQFPSWEGQLVYVIVSMYMHKRKISNFMSKFINGSDFHIVWMFVFVFILTSESWEHKCIFETPFMF